MAGRDGCAFDAGIEGLIDSPDVVLAFKCARKAGRPRVFILRMSSNENGTTTLGILQRVV